MKQDNKMERRKEKLLTNACYLMQELWEKLFWAQGNTADWISSDRLDQFTIHCDAGFNLNKINCDLLAGKDTSLLREEFFFPVI